MATTGRPLLAAAGDGGASERNSGSSPNNNNNNQNPNPNQPGKVKRVLIESACVACRRRKSKCDGARPTCSRCQNLRTDCIYEADAGESRWSALKRRNRESEAQRHTYRTIVDQIRALPESEARNLFQRIRSSNDEQYSELLREARESESTTNSAGASPTQTEQRRLPPIRTMVDVPGTTNANAAGHGASMARRQSLVSDGSDGSYSSAYSAHEPGNVQPPSA